SSIVLVSNPFGKGKVIKQSVGVYCRSSFRVLLNVRAHTSCRRDCNTEKAGYESNANAIILSLRIPPVGMKVNPRVRLTLATIITWRKSAVARYNSLAR